MGLTKKIVSRFVTNMNIHVMMVSASRKHLFVMDKKIAQVARMKKIVKVTIFLFIDQVSIIKYQFYKPVIDKLYKVFVFVLVCRAKFTF